MKFVNILTSIILLVSVFTNAVIAKEKTQTTKKKQAENAVKTIKFHKPQTDAERALDRILRVESGLERGNLSIKSEDLTTKAFKLDEDRQNMQYIKESGCEPKADPCTFVEYNIITGSQDILTDVGFLYHTITNSQGVQYVLLLPLGYKSQPRYYYDGKIEFETKFINDDNFLLYKMKKEDGKWKIDGTCFKKPVNCIPPQDQFTTQPI